MKSLAVPDISKLLVAACEEVLGHSRLGHHLAKASIERWFAFELAAVLDDRLREHGWVTVVERGGVTVEGQRLGNFDLLLVPSSAIEIHERVRVVTDPWPADAIAIELKGAHLADGSKNRETALLSDLTEKPERARSLGRPCAAFFGVLITTSGIGKNAKPRSVAATRKREMVKPKLAEGLKVMGSTDPVPASYRECWSGQVWVEIVRPEGDGDGYVLR